MEDHELAFNKAVQALEEKRFEDALETVRQNCKVRDFVCGTDKRNVQSEAFQYGYKGIHIKWWTLLHYALAYNQVEIVKLLLHHGAEIHTAEGTSTANWLNPLDVACLFGEEDTVGKFLSVVKEVRGDKECTEMINRKNGFGRLPIHYTAECKKAQIMRLILRNGADPTILDDRYKRNVLHFCAQFSADECLVVLHEHGSKSRFNTGQLGTRRIACDGDEVADMMGTGVDEVDDFGNTPLHTACRKDDVRTAKKLVDMGANVNVLSKKNRTPLFESVKNGSEKCAMLLLNHPKLALICNEELLEMALCTDWPRVVIDILKKWDHYRIASKPLLHKVVKSDVYSEDAFREVVTLLGKNYIEFTDELGRTPLMIAAMLNKHRMLAILVQVYLDILFEMYDPKSAKYKSLYESLIDRKDRQGDCSIHLAVMCDGKDENFERTVDVLEGIRKKKYLRTILKDHLLQHLQNKDGKTAVHLALENEKAERAVRLLDMCKGSGADLSDSHGDTIIHYAVSKIPPCRFNQVLKLITRWKTYEELVSLFEKRNEHGKAALHLALESKLNVRAKLLLNLKKDDLYIVDPNFPDGAGKNAIHIAVAQGLPVELLLERECDYTGVTMDSIDVKTAQLLIQHSVQAERSLDVCSKFLKGALKSAIEEERTDIVELLLVDSKDKLRIDLNILKTVLIDKENEELALLLVKHYHDDVHLLKLLNGEKKGDQRGTEILFHKLLNGEEKGDKRGTEILFHNLLNGEEGDQRGTEILFHRLINRMPDVAEEALNRNMVIDSEHKKRELLNTRYYLLEGLDGSGGDRSEDPLALIVKYERLNLFRHPLVVNFLRTKWIIYGLPLYLLKLFIFFLFVIVPVTVLFIPWALIAHCDTVDISVDNVTSVDNGNATSNCDRPPHVTNGIAGFLIVTLILIPPLFILCMLICRKMQLRQIIFPFKRTFFYSLVIFLPVIYAILTVVHTNTGCCDDHQWYFGLLAFILCCANFIRLFSTAPYIGPKFILFRTIVITFLKLLACVFWLLLASAIVLMVIFFDPKATRSPFSCLGRGLVTVLTMVVGELDYLDAFGFSYQVVDGDDPGVYRTHLRASLIIWIPFVILIPLVLNNMLTALAIDDIIQLRKNAELYHFKLQVQSVLSDDYYLNILKIWKGYKRGKSNRFVKAYILLMMIDHWKLLKDKMEDYKTKCIAEGEKLRQKYSRADQELKRSNTGMVQCIDNVKEVGLSCERKIKELKVVFNDSFKKLEAKVIKLGELSSKEKVNAQACL